MQYSSDRWSRRRWLAAASACAAVPGLAAAQQPAEALARVKARGRMTVGIYHAMPPFHVDGRGIDVDIANALAKVLGVQASLMPFHADENMNDDLRNMVWRGHYLGFGPADVLMHVPVDRPLMAANPRVQIFAPYFREQVAIARDLGKVREMRSLDDFAGQRIAVPGQTLAGWLLIGAESGRYREQLLTQWKDGTLAAAALQRGEVAAAAGLTSELESVLSGDTRFAIEPLPLPRIREGWAVGLAVKSEATDLSQALQGAMNELAQSGQLREIFERGKVRWRAA
ncbi:MAG: transporter substrate-binding domain-containing protein [Rubrivivax sp.]|jgi:ABC-type amino acid transport substrate-binding protein|nr:transporter substrate-binding domain-containing protein [Rubrivivax sp.]